MTDTINEESPVKRIQEETISLTSRHKKEGLALLREPLPKHLISWKCMPIDKFGRKSRCSKCKKDHAMPATSLAYAGHAAITDRLLEADIRMNYKIISARDENGFPITDKDGGIWIELTVCGVTRMGYGDANGKTGSNAMKERIGDALRNAAMRFGVGLELWHQGDLHVDDDEPGEERGEGPATEDPPVLPGPPENVDALLKDMFAAKSIDDMDSLLDRCKKVADPKDKIKVRDMYRAKITELARTANEPAPATPPPAVSAPAAPVAYDMDEPPPFAESFDEGPPLAVAKDRVRQLVTGKRQSCRDR